MKNAPSSAPHPVAEFMHVSFSDLMCRASALSDKADPRRGHLCTKIVRIGLFFDGTGNNRDRDQPRQSHSNVAKLFNAHVKDAPSEGIFKFYIPGVGTRFPEIGEFTEDPMGRAAGRGGQPRILWAMLQVYNALHRSVANNLPMFDSNAIKSMLARYVNEVENPGHRRKEEPPPPNRKQWFAELSRELGDRLAHAVRVWPLPSLHRIELSLFGFSRGAAEARAFCYWFADAVEDGQFAGVNAHIQFLGLFDTVASVGLADSASLTTPLWFADGHFDWAAEIRKPLPKVVKRVVHYVAAHEQRMNFPLTTASGATALEETMFPGVHADVGGGYGPGDHGRSPRQADLLSQVPLLCMYKEAMKAAVSLMHFGEIQDDVELKLDFEISQQLATAWNGYMQLAGVDADKKPLVEADHATLVKRHMGYYYAARALMLKPEVFVNVASFKAAGPQSRKDMETYNALLNGDLKLLRLRQQHAGSSKKDAGNLAFGEHANQFPLILLKGLQPLSEWEQWALGIFDQPPALPAEAALLALYVHDSLACFYLALPATTGERTKLIRRVQAKQAAGTRLNPVEQRIADAMATDPSLADKVRGGSDTADLELEDELRLEAVFPVLDDNDAKHLRDTVVLTQTSTGREGGGYLRPRGVF
jgi:hypothetical protein